MSEPTDETKPTVAQEEQKEEEEDDEEDLEKLQAEIERMEAEAARITQETQDIEKGEGASNSAATNKADSIKRDGCSIYVGQVDYSATPEELLAHFEACGTVERVTIVCDKMTGKPKGFAYLEFANEEAVENAIKLDGSTFKERTLKVTHKRVNDPKYKFSQEGGGRGYRGRGGRGFRGRGRGRRGGYRGGYRGGGGGGGGRGGGHHPYY